MTVWDQNLPVVQTTMALAPAKLDIPESSVKIVTKDSLEMKKATALVNLLSSHSRCLKMSYLDFSILAFSTNFCHIKIDLSGNTV